MPQAEELGRAFEPHTQKHGQCATEVDPGIGKRMLADIADGEPLAIDIYLDGILWVAELKLFLPPEGYFWPRLSL